ncbi:MAG TPA: hypothetical protein VFT43_12295, partial [Candidatus Polarisedimenticolia bacterium]|nr:hypothetical protein [Candidatus Polarisedimenticolia bacterium]
MASVTCALIAVFGSLAIFSFATWAGRGPMSGDNGRQVVDMRKVEADADNKIFHPVGVERPAGRAPLASLKETWEVPAQEKAQSIDTPLGWVNPARIGELRKKAPLYASDAATAHALRRGGQRGEIGAGFNAIQISEDALRGRSMDDVLADLAKLGVRSHGLMESRAALVEVPASAVEALAASPVLEAAFRWDPMFRLDKRVGETPMIEAKRARSEDFRLNVRFFPGTKPEEAHQELLKVAGPAGKVADGRALDGLTFLVTAHFSRLNAIARLSRVQDIWETTEYLLQNTDIPVVAMVGNVKENLPFQKPYQDVGVDGGGIDTNGDRIRVNNGLDAVPPQIVGVTDNGISLDSVQFAHTSSSPEGAVGVGPSHRKVHSIQAVPEGGDSGNGFTCDSPLSGSGTHGNVVAGVVAGDPSTLGFTLTRHYAATRFRVDSLPMDGVARGARILMQDAASTDVCTQNDLIERGGNVSPGNLLTRLTQAICPKAPATSGTCQGLIGGENEIHLHVMSFGVPNFDLSQVNGADGTYTSDARDIDTFLVNNRDY